MTMGKGIGVAIALGIGLFGVLIGFDVIEPKEALLGGLFVAIGVAFLGLIFG
jgi:hypothetical protein